MSAKQFQFHDDDRPSILRATSILADAVRVTLGPKSKCVLIEKKVDRPLLCDDGVTIAKEVEIKDPQANMGAKVIREAAQRTGVAVHDGTTNAALPAHAILAESVRRVTAGGSAVDLKQRSTSVDSIRLLSRSITTKREKAQVAAISAHSNTMTGDMVADGAEMGEA